MVIQYRLHRAFISLTSQVFNRIAMKLSSIPYGKGFKCCGNILFRNYAGKGGIVLGDNVSINSHIIAGPFNGVTKTRLVASKNGRIILRDGVSLSNVGIYSSSQIEIGEYTNIGGGSRICDTDFHSINPEYRVNGNTNVPTKPIYIGKRVFIGGHCLILKGVTIGDEAVIGGGSVITKSIPSKEIWAGNPAKFVKRIE